MMTAAGVVIALLGAAGFVAGIWGGALDWIGMMSAVLAFGLMLIYLGRARRRFPSPRGPRA